MLIWFALIVAPLLALTDQLVAFALVGWACARQSVALVHVSHLLFLAIAIAAAVGAWLKWRETTVAWAGSDDAYRQRHFLAGVGMTTAGLSSLAIAAMWIPTWMISSCNA
jgi:hypothetical protein